MDYTQLDIYRGLNLYEIMPELSELKQLMIKKSEPIYELIYKYLDNLRKDVRLELAYYPNGCSIEVLKTNLAEKKENEYEKNLIAYDVLSQISHIKEDVIKDEYITYRNQLCNTVLLDILTSHINIFNDMSTSSLGYDEMSRRSDINCNVMSAKLYNSTKDWTWNDCKNEFNNLFQNYVDELKVIQINKMMEARRDMDDSQRKDSNQRKGSHSTNLFNSQNQQDVMERIKAACERKNQSQIY